MSHSIISPISKSGNVILEKEIDVALIVEKYKIQLDIDVERLLGHVDKIGIYKCQDTGYRFYYPAVLMGDDLFYQELEKFPWYYMENKWEYEIADNYLKHEARVLEIGCGSGGFIKKVKNKCSVIEGLEMNSKALLSCIEFGLKVYPDSIECWSKNKKSDYDVVCSFQVLEHVADVRSFIEASLEVLKPGGLMIISVPNNDCLIFKSNDVALNIPPHHMGMWDVNSLISLQKYFEMDVEGIHLEPMQAYHVGYLNNVIVENFRNDTTNKNFFYSKFVPKFYPLLANIAATSLAENVIGHSVLVVYKKSYDKI